MTDRRTLWSNGSVAHSSLKGKVTADLFTDGVDHQVVASTTAIRSEPHGARDRECLFGQRFCVLEVIKNVAFGFARTDGYAGYVAMADLQPSEDVATHKVHVRHTVTLSRPDFKETQIPGLALSLGSHVRVRGMADLWAMIDGPDGPLYVPASHVKSIDIPENDPVAVAERLIGTPYVWGGNSAFGIDCSGLVQIACHACDIVCPGDSDQQARALGETLASHTTPKRGDVLFWKGHVGWVADSDTLLHANAHHMAVTYEPLTDAITRITEQGDGPVTRHARLIHV